jgi:hypothetical protein
MQFDPPGEQHPIKIFYKLDLVMDTDEAIRYKKLYSNFGILLL